MRHRDDHRPSEAPAELGIIGLLAVLLIITVVVLALPDLGL